MSYAHLSDKGQGRGLPIQHGIHTELPDSKGPTLPIKETRSDVGPVKLAGGSCGRGITSETLDAVELLLRSEVESSVRVIRKPEESENSEENCGEAPEPRYQHSRS